MPIYTAALFGNHNVVKYMYAKSNDFNDYPWTPQTRGWLLEKSVDNNMFGTHFSTYTFFRFFISILVCLIGLPNKEMTVTTH